MLKRALRSGTLEDPDPFGALAGAGGGAALWARQGTACAESGDLVGALQCFQRALESNLDCADAWAGLAGVFSQMHDPRRADQCLEIARRIRGQHVREATA
jgi:tetratricopeptide (TPR) repeat protein